MTQEFLRNKGGKENSTDCPNETENKNILLFFGEILDEKRKFVLITFLPRERENGTEHFEKKIGFIKLPSA